MPEIDEKKPKKSNVVTGEGCVRCCQKARSSAMLQVFQLLGDTIRALGEQVDFLEEHRSFGGISEQAQIAVVGFTRSPRGPIIEPPTYSVQLLPKGPQALPAGYEVSGTLTGALTLVDARRAIDSFQNTLELIANFQEALQKLPPNFQTKTKLADPCEECCRQRLLSQKNPRKIIDCSGKIRKRIG